jgi:hypothetical protein
MEALQAILRAVLIWLGFVQKPDFLMRLVADHPARDQMMSGWIYVVGGPGYQKWAYLLCPTGNGDIIQLSLQAKHRPRWQVWADFLGRPTVDPSVRQMEGSYAHFWIKSGRVLWCPDSGKTPDRIQRGSWQA